MMRRRIKGQVGEALVGQTYIHDEKLAFLVVAILNINLTKVRFEDF